MLRRDIHEHADAPDLLRLLRAGGERPCNGRTSYDFDEIAASHYSPQSSGARRLPADYIRDLRPAEWGLAFILRGNNPQDQMPALGQKRTFECVHAMSALPPKADIGTQSRHVRFLPKADILRCGKERRYSIT
jgi:hypothetical protein